VLTPDEVASVPSPDDAGAAQAPAASGAPAGGGDQVRHPLRPATCVVWAGISLCDVCSCHEISRARSGVGAGGQPPPPSALLKRLLEEVQEKTDIVRRCGVESLELRRQQAQLAAHNQVTTIQRVEPEGKLSQR
jgi:hypothetical protein